MKYITEFRNLSAAKALAQKIREIPLDQEIKIMEVCGGHTITFFKYGIKDLLPKNIHMISGPGCPVCVTSTRFIDHAIAISKRPDVVITSFGDLIRVPGSKSSLLKEKSNGADIRVCYCTTDALKIAKANSEKKVIFLGIGFETTAPTIAAAIKLAKEENTSNFFVLSAHKTMPNAMRALVQSKELDLSAFICPGHVSTITGSKIYEFISKDFGLPCVVSGFEPLDMLQSIYMIVRQIKKGKSEVENQYTRSVTCEGNKIAQKLIDEVFSPCNIEWRGLGVIPESGLCISKNYVDFDAEKQFPVEVEKPKINKACICGDIMRGTRVPTDCVLFAKACIPENPKGACMVSDEGSCATYFKYARSNNG